MTAVPFPDTHFHSVATLRDERGATFHPPPPPPSDTRRESATMFRSESAPLTVSISLFLLLLSISLWIQPCQALSVSVYLRVHLLCSHSSEMDAIVMAASVIKAMRGNHPTPPPPVDFQECTWNTH